MNSLPEEMPVMRLTWEGAAGRSYTLSATTNLLLDTWDDVPDFSGVPGTNGLMHYLSLDPFAPKLFFRVNAEFPDPN